MCRGQKSFRLHYSPEVGHRRRKKSNEKKMTIDGVSAQTDDASSSGSGVVPPFINNPTSSAPSVVLSQATLPFLNLYIHTHSYSTCPKDLSPSASAALPPTSMLTPPMGK
jgi:hypothetical protein